MAITISTTNERELVSKLTEWFNDTIKRNTFPFKEATNESPAKYDSKTYFGDIVLWKDRISRKAYSNKNMKFILTEKEKLYDWATAEKMAKEILEEYGIKIN